MTRLAHPSLFPMFLNLEGRLCVVVGAGRIAESKIAALRASGARVRVVAPRATRRVKAWSANREITWIPRRFAARDLNGSALVIAATNCPHTNQAIFDADASRRVPCNAVDDPARCDFYFPAIVRRGPLQIAISTSGCSPALAARLRRQLEHYFPAEYSSWVRLLGERRRKMMERKLPASRRRQALRLLTRVQPFELLRPAARGGKRDR